MCTKKGEIVVDSSDRFELSTNEDFVGRVSILMVEYAIDVIDSLPDNKLVTLDIATLFARAQDLLMHTDDNSKRYALAIAAQLPDAYIDVDVPDVIIRMYVENTFNSLAGVLEE